MTLATQGPRGPWSAAVFYVLDDDGLVFLSSPASRHASQLALDPRCAATIQDNVEDWRDIRGIQMEGLVHPVAGEAAAHARKVYSARFPVVGRLAHAARYPFSALAVARAPATGVETPR